ncbi:MAG: cyclase family protein [Chthoniobacterales bacterium]
MKIFDVSRTLSSDLAPWPGDEHFNFKWNGRIPDGNSVNLGMISMSLHNGTHADARFHFEDDGWTMEQAQLETYFGPAIVADLAEKYRDGAMPQMTVGDLAEHGDALRDAPRLFLKTNVWPDSKIFPSTIPTIAPEVPAWLQARGVKLLAFDVPSVDAITAKQLVNHHALAAAGISILESLDLRAVAAGPYHFIGLPLKIAGADGSPVRAILWRE